MDREIKENAGIIFVRFDWTNGKAAARYIKRARKLNVAAMNVLVRITHVDADPFYQIKQENEFVYCLKINEK